MKTFSIGAFLLVAAFVNQALAGDGCCCGHCGCANVKKVCRLVCEMKDVTTYEYEAECKDICLPGKSTCCGHHWEPDCHAWLGCKKVHDWQPHCSCHIRHQKLLVKVPVKKKVPSYPCVVDCICNQCGGCQVDPQATAMAREQGIMPVSAEMPIVLQDASAPVETPKQTQKPLSFIDRLFGKK
jgi:hypothetical protein